MVSSETILEDMLDVLREPALLIDPELRVLHRNAAATEHPVLGRGDPFAGVGEKKRASATAALARGQGAELRIRVANSPPYEIRLVPAGRRALAILSHGAALDGRDGFAGEQLGAVIATAVDGIMSIDARAHIELFNPACERIFGYTADEVLGRNIRMLMPSKFAEHHDQYLHSYLTTGVKRIIGIGREVEGLRKSGETFPMDLSVGEFWHEGERRFVGTVRDLSARAASERRLYELQNQVAHMGRVSAVAEMGSALAHELNQPLTAMTLYLTAADRAILEDPEKAADLFRRSKVEAARAGEIVRRIRQMVERTDHEMAMFNLADIVKASIELCRIADPSRNSTITVEGLPPQFQAFGDETQIQQVVVNLVKNALDATEGQADRHVRVCAHIDRELELFIEDNGPGVSEEISDRLFSPFASTKPNGLGIGLSICRNIVEAHGGRLDLVSPSPLSDSLGGACFRIRLPLETLNDA